MKEIGQPTLWNQTDANHARQRYQNRQQRLLKQAQEKTERLKKQKQMLAKLKTRK